MEIFDRDGKALSVSEVMAILPSVTSLEKVTRVEVVDQHGRSYVNYDSTNSVAISIQDEGRTLKVFIS